jgi:hypothetical protein
MMEMTFDLNEMNYNISFGVRLCTVFQRWIRMPFWFVAYLDWYTTHRHTLTYINQMVQLALHTNIKRKKKVK